jgi:hypothetical protein
MGISYSHSQHENSKLRAQLAARDATIAEAERVAQLLCAAIESAPPEKTK